eukprot:2527325-Lingulodinium_polyedra.AAC.1
MAYGCFCGERWVSLRQLRKQFYGLGRAFDRYVVRWQGGGFTASGADPTLRMDFQRQIRLAARVGDFHKCVGP